MLQENGILDHELQEGHLEEELDEQDPQELVLHGLEPHEQKLCKL